MAVYVLGIVQFIIIGAICYFELKLKSPVIFLWATLFIMFGVMHLYASLSGDIMYPDSVLCQASLFVIGFCFFYICTRIILVKFISSSRYNVLKYDSLRNSCMSEDYPIFFFAIMLLVAIILKLVPYIKHSGGLLFTSWGLAREYSASLDYFNSSQFYSIIYYVFSGLAIYSFLKNRNKTTFFILLIYIIEVIITRNRIEVLPVFISLITIYIFKIRKIKISTIIFIVVLAISVIYCVYGLRVFRHYGTISVFLHDFRLDEFNDKIKYHIETDNGELGLRKDFYFFIYGNNKFYNFGKGHSYIRMLLVFVPTQWSLGLKPPDFAQSMGTAIGMVAGGSTHPTLFGDCYANLGWFGVLLGIFWAIFASASDYIIITKKESFYLILLYALFSVGYVIMGRGSVYNGFVYVAYGVVIISILRYLTSHIKIADK